MKTAGRLANIDALKVEIADNVSLSTIAEHLGVELQPSGDQWKGLCPLHEESTPSFYVSDPKGVYHCFGCKEGGDAIDLVQKVRHLSFIETLYYLAAEADVDVSAYERPMTDSERAEAELRDWCEQWLSEGEDPWRTTADVSRLFGVVEHTHYASKDNVILPAYFQEKEWALDGVIFPWRTPSGRLVGWRIREHESQDKRIAGTPNSFPLGRTTDSTLFGIQVAREHIDRILVGVEGEYDTLACHSADFRHVVGMGGSTLTEGQVKLLKSLNIREFVAVFDGDTGGYAAAKSFANKHWADPDIFFRVAVCDDGKDPEDTLFEQGAFYFDLLVAGAKSALEYLLRLEWTARPRVTLTEKLEFVKWIRDTYGQKLRSTDESLVLSEIAGWLGVPELEVRDYVRASTTDLSAVDSERLLIGKAARDKGFYVYLRERLNQDDFHALKHQRIWELLADMLIDGQDFDAVTLAERAGRHGIPDGYIAGCAELVDSNWEYHLGVVADLALRRSARSDALEFKDRIGNLAEPADILVGDLTHRITTKALQKQGAKQRQLSEQVDLAMDTLHERMHNPTEIHGIDLGTQYPKLSRILQGLQPRRLVLLAAVSRVGKSTMLAHWAVSMGVHQSIPIDFISLEMDEVEILYKMSSHMTGIDSMKISGGRLDVDESKAVEQAMLRIRNSPLHIWAPDGLTGTEFMLYSREAVMQRRTQAFLLDYVQLIDPEVGQEKDNGYKLYGDFGRLCKMKVARGMEVTVVLAAQLRREAAGKERPTAEDMADSYALVRHSDVIVILHGQEESSTLELWVDKNRQGAGGGLIPMQYDKPRQTFHEASGSDRQPEYLIRV